MWIIIVIVVIVIVVLFNFNSDRNAQTNKIDREGGMRKKYSELIEHLCGSKGEVLRQSGSSITIGASSIGGSTLFILTQTFGNLTVQWKVDSPVFGKHNLEWEFPEYENQVKMIQKIESDLMQYNKKMMGL